MVPFSSLAQPVGALMRPTVSIARFDSLARGARLVRETSAGFLPVVDEGLLVGVLTEQSLADCLERGVDPLASAQEAVLPALETLPLYLTGAEVLRRLRDLGVSELPVVDRDGRLVGVIGASDLYPRVEEAPHLPIIGGMATPFGVYLTAGGVRGGAGPFALVSAGMLLFCLFLATSLVGEWGVGWVATTFDLGKAPDWVYGGVPFLLFLISIRAIPLAGIHAAEHQVVHALERGEPLEVEVVRRMPRVHPRCGTNLAVGFALFTGLSTWQWTSEEQLRILVAMIVTLFAWRPLGNLTQFLVTTKPANDAQIRSGIRAAKQLIENFHRRGRMSLTFGQRLASSGIFHVLAGSTLMLLIAEGIARLFGYSLGL